MGRRIRIRFPWFTLSGTPDRPGWRTAFLCRVEMLVHEWVTLLFGHRAAHARKRSVRFAVGVSEAPYVLRDVPGFPDNPQSIGQFREVTKDIVWTSDGANEVAIARIAPRDVGLVSHIFGVLFLGQGDPITPTDDSYVVTTFITDGVASIQARQLDGTALDLDNTDTATIRVAIRGI